MLCTLIILKGILMVGQIVCLSVWE